jgi:hypothetical protein
MQALAVLRHEGVEVDEPSNARRHAIGNAGGDHAAVAVTHEHDVGKILALDHAQHVGDVRVQGDGAARLVRALAEAGVGGGENLVAGGPDQRPHLPPRPAGRPGPVTDQKCRHSACVLPASVLLET